MFLHLGNNIMVNMNKIIAILDLETAADSPAARSLLNNIIKDKEVESIAEKGKEKSFVIAEGSFYLSPISSNTLLKRSMNYGEYGDQDTL